MLDASMMCRRIVALLDRTRWCAAIVRSVPSTFNIGGGRIVV